MALAYGDHVAALESFAVAAGTYTGHSSMIKALKLRAIP
jgi:hypothetical protein